MITPKGNYSNIETYEILDLVTYNGSSYICKKTSTNVSPTVEANWQICSLKGEQGEQGNNGATGATGATGNGIASIEKTKTEGLVDTYTITYTDGTTDEIKVTNGADFDERKLDAKLEKYEKKHNYFTMTIKEEISAETEVEIPCSYVVGNNEIDIFIDGIYLVKETSADMIGNYREVGEVGTMSNKVMLGFDLEIAEELIIIKKGAVEDDNE